MIIYNVTVNIEDAAQEDWLYWMRNEHIPAMLATGKFTKALMTKVLVKEQMGGTSYSIQYTAVSRDHLNRYLNEDAENLRAAAARFTGKAVSFNTELEVVTEQFQSLEK